MISARFQPPVGCRPIRWGGVGGGRGGQKGSLQEAKGPGSHSLTARLVHLGTLATQLFTGCPYPFPRGRGDTGPVTQRRSRPGVRRPEGTGSLHRAGFRDGASLSLGRTFRGGDSGKRDGAGEAGKGVNSSADKGGRAALEGSRRGNGLWPNSCAERPAGRRAKDRHHVVVVWG